MSATATVSPKFPHRTANNIYNNCQKMPTLTGWKIVFSSMVQVKGLPNRFDMFGRKDFINILISEAGQGKTTVPYQICKKNGIPFIVATHAGQQSEDWTPMTLNMLDPKTEQPLRIGYGDMWKDYDQRSMFLIDDTLSADSTQQGQIRSILTHHTLGGVKLGRNLYIAGATNPSTVDYMTNKPFDHSLEKRSFFIPVTMEQRLFMSYISGNNPVYDVVIPEKQVVDVPLTPYNTNDGSGGFYEPLYLFLSQEGGSEAHGWTSAADYRRWVNISDSMARMIASGLVTTEEMFVWLSYVLPEEVVNAYRAFLEKSSDPDDLMIPAYRLMNAEQKDFETFITRMEGWHKHPRRNILLEFTVSDILGWLDHGFSREVRPAHGKKYMTPTQAHHMKTVMSILHETQVMNILQAGATGVFEEVWGLLFGTPQEKLVQELMNRSSRESRGQST